MDVAVSDGGASAPAAPSSVPVDTSPQPSTQPLGTQTPVAEKPPAPEPKPEPKAEKPEPSKSAREALTKASEKLKAQEAEKAKTAPKPEPKEAKEPVKAAEPKEAAKPEPKPAEAADKQRDETGRFVSDKPAEAKPVSNSPHREPPARFSPDAKAAWQTAPEPVQAEVHRAIKELEQGHQKYKADSEAYEQVRQFDEIARQNGGNLKSSLDRVVELENAFQRNPIEGFQKVADHFGLSLRSVAAHIMGQTPDQVQQRQDQTVARLNQTISQLEQKLSGVTETIQQQRQAAVIEKIQSFAADKPRFEELSDTITQLLATKMAKDLPEAYEMADRLKPAPSLSPAVAQPISSAPELQARPLNPAGSKSISGAPASGSSPTSQAKPSSSNREALQRAMARVGRI